MHNASFAEHLASWDQLASGVSSRAKVSAQMQSQQEELIQARKKVWEAHLRRLAAKAAAQQATRDLEAAMEEAHEVATRLRCSVWSECGRESPALYAFGMRPYPCSRARRAALSAFEGESLPNVVPEPAPSPPASEVKGEPSPSAREAEDRRGAVPQREPDAQTSSGGIVNDGERLPNDLRPSTHLLDPDEKRDGRADGVPQPAVGGDHGAGLGRCERKIEAVVEAPLELAREGPRDFSNLVSGVDRQGDSSEIPEDGASVLVRQLILTPSLP